jgi:hypothetical protein
MRRMGSQLVLVMSCAGLMAACSTGGSPTLTSGLPEQGEKALAATPAATPAAAPAPAPVEEPGLSAFPSISALTKGANQPVGSATEVYTRVARGALTCWFGAAGPLKGPYIYHADAEPPSKGGRAEIVIRTRDKDAADPRSLKAFRVGIQPGGQGTQIEVENVKIAEPLAARLTSDVQRWAADQEGCGEAPITAGWTAEQGVAATAAKAGKTGTKKAAAKP